MNFLTKNSKAFYYAYGILIAVMIIAGLFYASQYCDVRVFYSLVGDNVEILPTTADNLNRSNSYVFEYFGKINSGDPYGFAASGFNADFSQYARTVYDFQVALSSLNTLIVVLGLVSLICFALLLVLSNHSRRIYYVSNLVGGILLPLAVVVCTVILFVQNLNVMGVFNKNQELFNIVSLLQGDSKIGNSQTAYTVLQQNYTCNSLTFVMFMILFIIVIVYSVFMMIYAYLKYKSTAEERAEIVKKAVANND